MKKLLYYVMLIERGKNYNKINQAMVVKHVEYIKKLDDNGQLVLCGPLKGYPGTAGMIIIKAKSYEEADVICKSEPFVAEGYAAYKLITLEVGNKDNNYLLKKQ
ncbi:MAG: YciI family protein [Treponema sp.]|nr:YciI family protein [Treponema sp.]